MAGSSTAAPEATQHLPEVEETEAELINAQVDDLILKADELEKKVIEVVNFYEKKQGGVNAKGTSLPIKDKASAASHSTNAVNNGASTSNNKQPAEGAHKDAACSKRMQDLMRQFGTMLRQITTHKWAWPFMQPVDVEGLGLHDYYEIIKKPMDIGTIQNRMEGKDEVNRYKNVREIYADVRLVFKNAMRYNDENNDVHVMAKTLLEKFEEKWLQLLPKVIEEETRQKEEEAQVSANIMIAQEASISRLARETDNELCELSLRLKELRQMAIESCRKMTSEEKRKLGTGLSNLSPEDLNKALEIIAQDNPNFQYTAEEVDLDMDAQSELTLWRLKFFVREAHERQTRNNNNNNNSATKGDDASKRKREICDALAKSAKKRGKKQSP
ncbi:Transcription factor GTE1 [Rhynchospora pubera]|uniref:Transcription factor GTE1 n=1 Tax=Rhynchospora pubera TaxID=906938 RepID=A0AAV8GQQ9_9POAL|nr:Transcription factor GTE1 [Rhynchospora pubera]